MEQDRTMVKKRLMWFVVLTFVIPDFCKIEEEESSPRP